MSCEISNEQKAHDLAVAFTTRSSSKNDSAEDFYQDYEQHYNHFLKIVKHYND